MACVCICTACSGQEEGFIIKGKFTNLKEGELYFYNPEGDEKMDTVTIRDGRFTYRKALNTAGYYILLFPNMSEQVVFAEPDLSVELSADATHLKETQITGGAENALMTGFREKTRQLNSPALITEKADTFIRNHPASLVSIYLLDKYFIGQQQTAPDQMKQLVNLMAKAQPKNPRLLALKKLLASQEKSEVGKKAPDFKVIDRTGQTHTLAQYKNNYLLLTFWATWQKQSQDEQKEFKALHKEWEKKLSMVSISLDLQRQMWKSTVRFDSLPGGQVCDQRAWDSPVVTGYHVNTLPTYILIGKDQTIIAREYELKTLKEKLDSLIK